MASKINAGEDMKRGDLYFVDPYQIIVKEELRGRSKPPTEEQIIELAESMMNNGQRQPVECRKTSDSRLLLNLGFTRNAAARLIREGFTNFKGEHRQDENFKLKVVISDANDEQAFYNNIVENAHRNATSPIDDAKNQHRMRDQYGKTNEEIAELYRYRDVQKVVRLQRLLALPAELQALVHDGSLPVSGALELLDLPGDKRLQEIKAATAESGKVVGTQVRAQVREHMLNDENREDQIGNSDKKPNQKKPRSVKELRDFMAEVETSTNEIDKEFAKSVKLWLSGARKDKFLMDAIIKHRTASSLTK